MRMDDKRILSVMKTVDRWVTFDELYNLVQCDYDWTDFALQVERLVEQGYIQHFLLPGMEVGLYKLASRNIYDG